MTRTDIINKFIETRGYKSYLEIGVFTGENFKAVKCKNKVAVDPNPQMDIPENSYDARWIYKKTSDEYFGVSVPNVILTPMFDIIFIDGLHTEEQVTKDINNSLKVLNKGGVILLHDCNPPTELHARPLYTTEIPEWNGTVYRAYIDFRARFPYETYVIDTDWGVGVIDQPLKPPIISPVHGLPSDFKDFAEHRNYYLNLISPEEFLKKLDESRVVHDGV